MRSNGLATILLLIPVLAVPGMAIFGIPQFAPIVTSPLDEGHDFDREKRVGSAERPAQDELFGDFDGFSSETQANDDIPSENRNSLVAIKNSPKPTSNRTKNSKFPKGSSDWDSENEWSESLPQPEATNGAGSTAENPNPSAVTNSSNPIIPANDQPPAPPKRPPKRDKSFRQASAIDDFSSSVADSAKKTEPPKRLPNPREPRDPARRAMTNTDPLTWQTAIVKLNEMGIHDFRIEPSYASDQFVFTCWYTPPDGSRVIYRFEAEAEEPLKAVEKALEQIIQRQQQQ